MSSSFTYTFRNRRVCPASSRRCGFRSGNCVSRAENNSSRLDAEHVIFGVPAVRRRNALGICTVTLMLDLQRYSRQFAGKICNCVQFALKKNFELPQFGSDWGFGFVLSGEHVGRFKTVASYTKDGRFVRQNAIL